MVGLRLHSALVVENVRDAVGWIAAVILPVVIVEVMAGRTVLVPCERGIRNTFANEASTGESGRIVWVVDVMFRGEVRVIHFGGDCSAEVLSGRNSRAEVKRVSALVPCVYTA